MVTIKFTKDMCCNMLIAKALEVAAQYHEKGYRKGREIPYIVHPFEVALILRENDMSDEVIAAGILHDTLEDTELTKEEIKELFGERILELVVGASEKLEDREQTPWQVRKEHTINYLKTAPREVQYIACADKLSNVWSMIRDYHKSDIGEEFWDRFMRKEKGLTRKDKKRKQKWYYDNIVISLKDLEGIKMYEELKKAVKKMFEEI